MADTYATAPPPVRAGLGALIDDLIAAIDDAETARAALNDDDRADALLALRSLIARLARMRGHLHEWGHV